MWPFSMPIWSSRTFSTGLMALVVQLAALKTFSFSMSRSLWLMPYTMFGTSFPGAVSSTLPAPLAFRWRSRSGRLVKAPVLSMINALWIP